MRTEELLKQSQSLAEEKPAKRTQGNQPAIRTTGSVTKGIRGTPEEPAGRVATNQRRLEEKAELLALQNS